MARIALGDGAHLPFLVPPANHSSGPFPLQAAVGNGCMLADPDQSTRCGLWMRADSFQSLLGRQSLSHYYCRTTGLLLLCYAFSSYSPVSASLSQGFFVLSLVGCNPVAGTTLPPFTTPSLLPSIGPSTYSYVHLSPTERCDCWQRRRKALTSCLATALRRNLVWRTK